MAVWGLAVTAVVLVVGVWLGLAGPETTPVDPAQFGGGPGGGPQ